MLQSQSNTFFKNYILTSLVPAASPSSSKDQLQPECYPSSIRKTMTAFKETEQPEEYLDIEQESQIINSQLQELYRLERSSAGANFISFNRLLIRESFYANGNRKPFN